jgi:hypothetical protein
MFAGLQTVCTLRSSKVSMKTLRVDEHVTANPTSMSLLIRVIYTYMIHAILNTFTSTCPYIHVCTLQAQLYVV